MDIEEIKKLEERIDSIIKKRYGSPYNKEQADRFLKMLDDIWKNEKPKKKKRKKE